MSAQAQPSQDSQPLIRLRGITKVYGEGELAFQALKGVDLDIEQGDFVAIMGPSGSGKSTAMNTLGCLDRPTTGEYLFKGVHVESLSRDERARLRRRYFGFVFQGFHLLPRTTAQWAKASSPVRGRGLARGDFVFFNTLGGRYSHMGIFVGNGQFVHAPSSGGTVQRVRMDNPYFAKRFTEARSIFA